MHRFYLVFIRLIAFVSSCGSAGLIYLPMVSASEITLSPAASKQIANLGEVLKHAPYQKNAANKDPSHRGKNIITWSPGEIETLLTGVRASSLQQNTCELSNEIKSESQVVHVGKNSTDSCSYFEALRSAGLMGERDIAQALQKVNWDPCCLTHWMKWRMERSTNSKPINGFSVGFENIKAAPRLAKGSQAAKIIPVLAKMKGVTGASISGSFGTELVVIVTPHDTLQVGVVFFTSMGSGVSLPWGAGFTQAVLKGKCNQISDYLGHFSTISGVGMTKSTGVTEGYSNPFSDKTGCDSESLITGFNTPLVASTDHDYVKAGKYYELTGPGVKPMIKALKKLSRRRAPDNKLAKGKDLFYEKDYSKENCRDSLWSQYFNSEGDNIVGPFPKDKLEGP